jgi:hypothetical protein
MSNTLDLAGAPTLPPPPLDPFHKPPSGWRKFFAIAGIVGGFLILFTIPGWAAIGTYRRWKAGQRGQPNLLIAWGVCFVLLCSGFVVLEVAARVAPAGTARALSGIVPEPKASVPPGVPESTSSPGEDGWTRYEVSEGGFSFELPEGWQPGVNGTDGEPAPPEALFVATLFDSNGGAGFAVTRVPGADVTEEPLETGERVAAYIQREGDTLGKVEVSGLNLPIGSSYLVEWESEAPEDLYDTGFMMYGATNYGYAYQFIFAFPLVDGDYRTQADYIARSIMWTD